MWFWAFAAAAVIAIFIQYRVYKKHSFDKLRYSVTLSSPEVFEGDEIFFYEELENSGTLPLPYVKISTDLPEGLEFMLTGEKSETRERCIQSIFTMRPGTVIKRRWRVICTRRGEYEIGGVIALTNDIFGTNARSKQLTLDESSKNHIVVLPRPAELEEHYTSSMYLCGDVISNHCPITDPLRICGAREYSPLDPMNKINWKQTARHSGLMVNLEERTVRYSFSVVLNMNTREIEQRPLVCSDTLALERNITVCTSILDRAAGADLPVRIIANTPLGTDCGFEPVADDKTGEKIMISREYRGKNHIIDAMRMLASVKPEISVPSERMFDHMLKYPELYRGSENYIIISAYLDQRMLNFHSAMAERGVQVIFYLTTSRNAIGEIPAGVELYYKTY